MPAKSLQQDISTYLQYLPAIFHEDVDNVDAPFINGFLLAFEQVLTGRGNPDDPGLEERLDGITGAQLAGIQRYFEPGPDLLDLQRAPKDFLPWLASWVALSLRDDWNETERRRLISQIVPLYQQRGTRQGLKGILQTYLALTDPERDITIQEYFNPLQVGDVSTVGVDTSIGGIPHYFSVHVVLRSPDADKVWMVCRSLPEIIDAWKPAHTYYDLAVGVPTIIVGDAARSQVGVSTFLGMPLPAHEMPPMSS